MLRFVEEIHFIRSFETTPRIFRAVCIAVQMLHLLFFSAIYCHPIRIPIKIEGIHLIIIIIVENRNFIFFFIRPKPNLKPIKPRNFIGKGVQGRIYFQNINRNIDAR